MNIAAGGGPTRSDSALRLATAAAVGSGGFARVQATLAADAPWVRAAHGEATAELSASLRRTVMIGTSP